MIATMRQRVNAALAPSTLERHPYVPDDIAVLPCLVTGPVSISESETPTAFDLTTSIFVIGRRISDDDSQIELDSAADGIVALLGGTRGVAGLTVTACTPQLVNIASEDLPAYVIVVEATIIDC